jgi:hypothetical protein
VTIPPGTLVRAGGVALAGVLPSWRSRGLVLAGSYATGWVLGPHGIQLLSVSGLETDNALVRDGAPAATATASWTAAQLGALAALRALPLPRLLTVPAYAAVLAVAEGRLVAGLERAQAAAVAAADKAGSGPG